MGCLCTGSAFAKYGQNPDPIVKAVQEIGSQHGVQIEILVQDTGSGMTGNTMTRIFEPSFTTKLARGRGLGLSNTHAIVARAGGYIVCESKVGAGSTFRLFFPRLARQAEPEPLNSNSEYKRDLLSAG